MAAATTAPLNDFHPARKEKSGVAIAIAGSSGSGKTKTALEIAVGLAGPEGRIAVIDTEGKRALHYARQYPFDHCHFLPPYSPERCTAQIAKAQSGPYDVVIFDSASDEHEGEGGLIELADAEGAWTKTKQRHKYSLIRRIRSYPGFVIFCLRAEEKVKYEKVNGKTVLTPMGWMPICEKRFMYDMTLSFTLSPETPGKIRFDLPRKIGDDFKPLFKEGEFITRKVGEGLRAWALDGEAPRPEPDQGGGQESANASGASTPSSSASATGTATTIPPADKTKATVDGYIKQVNEAKTEQAIDAILTADIAKKQIEWMADKRPAEHDRLYEAVNARKAKIREGVPA